MNPAKQKQLLALGILELLSEDKRLVNERFIKLALSVEFTISVTYTDLRQELEELERDKQIHAITSQDKGVLYGIGTAGRARLSEIHG